MRCLAVMGGFTLRNNLTDLCEVGMDRKLCWEASPNPHRHLSRNLSADLEGKSAFQHSIILDHKQFGRQLFLDCQMQSSTAEEFFYHEAIPSSHAYGARQEEH